MKEREAEAEMKKDMEIGPETLQLALLESKA